MKAASACILILYSLHDGSGCVNACQTRSNLGFRLRTRVAEFYMHANLRCSSPSHDDPCLKDVTLLYIGDSTSRYEYLELVNGLHAAGAGALHAGPPGGGGASSTSVDHNIGRGNCEPSYGSWQAFYNSSTSNFSARMLCDCFRLPPRTGLDCCDQSMRPALNPELVRLITGNSPSILSADIQPWRTESTTALAAHTVSATCSGLGSITSHAAISISSLRCTRPCPLRLCCRADRVSELQTVGSGT